MTGTLYVVATPIGNLEDLTFRALRILREVDLIAAEDTRRTSKLLARYEIRKPLISVREHNELREADRLVARLEAGTTIALVSDAGTPGISDPGARLVRAARSRGLSVVPVPGPSAVTAAISVAGIAGDEFVFMGFPPATGSRRTEWFERLAADGRLTVMFEAPHRIRRTLEELREHVEGREIQIYRELTKINEIYAIWPISGSPATTEKGEFTLVIGPSAGTIQQKSPDYASVFSLFGRLTKNAGFTEAEAIAIAACQLGLDIKAIAKIVKKAKISVKQQNQSLP